jgi:hypothetical protein
LIKRFKIHHFLKAEETSGRPCRSSGLIGRKVTANNWPPAPQKSQVLPRSPLPLRSESMAESI